MIVKHTLLVMHTQALLYFTRQMLAASQGEPEAALHTVHALLCILNYGR